MTSTNPLRSTLSLTQLEDRTNPAPMTFTVKNTAWNLGPGTLLTAIAAANANPDVDTIDFNYGAAPLGLGTNTPLFTSNLTHAITEGVIIEMGGGLTYATITGARPFDFTHNKAATPENPNPSKDSIIRGGVFFECAPLLVGGAVLDGGAVRVFDGQLTTFSTRFSRNSAVNGGAVWVGSGATLVLDGGIAPANANAALPGNLEVRPDPAGYPMQVNNGISKTLFQWNKAWASDGGAIETEGTVILKKVAFNLNEAVTDGGAINTRLGATGKVEVPAAPGGQPQFPFTDVQIVHNKASKGGGVSFKSTAVSTLHGVVVKDNSATVAGGGLHVLDGTVNVHNGEIKHNNAPKGSGLFVGAAVNETPKVAAWSVVFGQNFGAPIDIEVCTGGTLDTHGCVLNNDVIGTSIRPGATLPGVHTPDPLNPDVP